MHALAAFTAQASFRSLETVDDDVSVAAWPVSERQLEFGIAAEH